MKYIISESHDTASLVVYKIEQHLLLSDHPGSIYTIPQQIEKVKEEIERENKTNRIMTTTKEQLQKKQEQSMFDLKYKKRVNL